MHSENQILKPLVDASETVVPVALWQQHRCVVAVSGGADSVALFRTLVEIAGQNQQVDLSNLIVGHLDHGARGAESEADEAFVKQLASEFKVGFVSARLDLARLLEGRETASEELLRDARYGCLKKIAQDHDARYLFTGHHLNDQAETILFRIFRGTGLAGLKGIPAIRRDGQLTIVRPFLKVPKKRILEALSALNQPFRTDATNATSDYSRNFIRNEILKSAQNHFGPHVEEAIARLADHAEGASELEAESVRNFLALHPPLQNAGEVSMRTSDLNKNPKPLIRAVLIRVWQQQRWPVDQMNFDRWQALADKILSATVEAYVENLPGDLRLEVTQKVVKISSKP